MIISEDQDEVKKYISCLYDRIQKSTAVNDLINSYLTERSCEIDEKQLEYLAKKAHCDKKSALVLAALEVQGLSFGEAKRILHEAGDLFIIDAADSDKLLNDPFYRNIAIEGSRVGNWSLKSDYFEPYELFVADDIALTPEGFEVSRLGYFTDRMPFIEVLEDQRIWMSMTPSEIQTMQKAIDEAHGRVLTYGLGLGYFAYVCALKGDVESVTVVEKDQRVIELFEKVIRPQLGGGDRISIIREDVYEFAASLKSLDYDFVFADIWHDAADGLLPFIFLRNLEQNPNCRYTYWIDDGILIYLRRLLVILLYEECFCPGKVDYSKDSTPEDLVIGEMHRRLEDRKISSASEVEMLLERRSLLQIATELGASARVSEYILR